MNNRIPLSDLNPGDKCWVYGIGDMIVKRTTGLTITTSDSYYSYKFIAATGNMLSVEPEYGDYFEYDIDTVHPMLFHSFAEFINYWKINND